MDTPPVHTEGTPSKCGLCNMSDCFDVETQVCFRCTTVPKARPIAKPAQSPSPEDRANVFKRLNSQFDDSVKPQSPHPSNEFIRWLLMLLSIALGSSLYSILRSQIGYFGMAFLALVVAVTALLFFLIRIR